MVVLNLFSWLAHRCSPKKFRSRRMSFLFDLPLSWALYGWPERSPISCHNPLDMTRFPMIFWGPTNGPGAVKKKRKVASLRDIEGLCATQPSDLIFSLWPWSWWVPGSRSVKDPHHNRLKFRAQATKRIWLRAGGYRNKKMFFFLWWMSIYYWQVPFNGCQHLSFWI